MATRKKENRGLPARWRLRFGAYYYRVPPGLEAHWDGKKEFRLGDKLHEAYKVWTSRINRVAEAKTIGQLLDRYVLEVIPAKAAASRTGNINQLQKLKEVFGDMPLEPFAPRLVYQYVDRRSVKKEDGTGGRIAAHREMELLSHAYTKAVEWGYIDRHPFLGQVRLKGETPRDRYVEDWEVIELLSLEPFQKKGSVTMIQAYLRLKLLTGMAQGDLLRLQMSQIREDGIHVTRHKTAKSSGKRTIYERSPELDEAIAMAKAARPVHLSPYLFCNRNGEGYINEATGKPPGWKSMWQRFMARVLKETTVTEPFTEHDLRAKVGSDAESLEKARALLAHVDSRTTERVYRRKPERVSTGKP